MKPRFALKGCAAAPIYDPQRRHIRRVSHICAANGVRVNKTVNARHFVPDVPPRIHVIVPLSGFQVISTYPPL